MQAEIELFQLSIPVGLHTKELQEETPWPGFWLNDIA